MQRLAQIAKRDEQLLPVPKRYVQVLKFADGNPEYKEKLFGIDVIAGAPARYLELEVIFSRRLSTIEWREMSLSERGEQIAFLRLRNMASLIERHEELQRRELEKARRGHGKGQQDEDGAKPPRKGARRAKRSRG